jgi:phage terminase large subunit
VAQHLLFDKFYSERDIRILITRKTGPALKKSAWLLINDMIKQYDLPMREQDRNRSDLVLTYGSNQIYFTAIDDPDKLKSFERINYIWGEEASEYTKEDYIQLGLRCRGKNPNGKNRLFFSFNPVDEQSYLRELTGNAPYNIAVNHSTYRDNAFLEQEYIEQIESLQEQDPTYWKIYGLGEWATPENLIYTNWDIVPDFPEDIYEVGYGLDFGYIHPAVLLKIAVHEDDAYVDEVVFESKLLNSELIDRMKQLIPEADRGRIIIADSAEPDKIEEISQAGFNIFPSIKGKRSVHTGIDRVKRYNLHITSNSANLIQQMRGYKRKVDKNGNILDEPVKFKDDGPDALRYYLGQPEPERAEVVYIGQYRC